MTHQKIPDARDIDGEGWISWGGARPVAATTVVEVKLRDGRVCHEDMAGFLEWRHEGHPADIIAYRVVAPASPSPAAVEHVERGEEGRFTKFAPEQRAEIPDDAPTEFHKLTTRELIAEAGQRPPPKTMRDEFAMAALTGMLANSRAGQGTAFDDPDEFYEHYSTVAYGLADAMMEARTVTRTGDR